MNTAFSDHLTHVFMESSLEVVFCYVVLAVYIMRRALFWVGLPRKRIAGPESSQKRESDLIQSLNIYGLLAAFLSLMHT